MWFCRCAHSIWIFLSISKSCWWPSFFNTIFLPSLIYSPGSICAWDTWPFWLIVLTEFMESVQGIATARTSRLLLQAVGQADPSSLLSQPLWVLSDVQAFLFILKDPPDAPCVRIQQQPSSGTLSHTFTHTLAWRATIFFFKCSRLGYLHVVIFHWTSHTYTNLSAGSSSQGTPRLREN